MSDDQLQPTSEAPPAYRSSIAAIVHEGVAAMHGLGLVDAETLQAFDQRCLTGIAPKELAP